MNKENIKLNYKKDDYSSIYYIIAGYQHTTVGDFKIYSYHFNLNEFVIVMLSYLNYCENLNNSFFIKYKPYLYHDLNLIDMRAIRATVRIEEVGSSGYQQIYLPKFEDIFDNEKEFEKYVKEYFNSKERHSDYYGTLLEFWEIDEVKAVLKQAGWNQYELEHLKYIDDNRGFMPVYHDVPIESNLSLQNENISISVKKYIKCLISTINNMTTETKVAGHDCFSGVFVYKIDKNTAFFSLDDDEDVVIMPNGDKYYLHEGD